MRTINTISSKPWANWNLENWLLHLEERWLEEIQLGLDRILEVATRLNLHTVFPKVITVGGTNGKGSTVSALERIYHTAGYQVGAYTSPHLISFNERIKVNLKAITDSELCEAFSIIEEARASVPLTYFETTTLAALWFFKKHPLDLIILEVGLGGRLDATNIIDASVSIITGIDYDHQNFLGTTLEQIGGEKAGILRPLKPFIYADTNPPKTILEKAQHLQSRGHFFEKEYSFIEEDDSWVFCNPCQTIELLPKPKIHLKSASAAIHATALLQEDLPFATHHLYTAMQLINIPGRLQYQSGKINILYDVAHNAQSAKLLAEVVKKKKKGRVHAVFSALKDKDVLGLIEPLKDCVDLWYPAQLNTKRASGAEFLLSVFEQAEIKVDFCYTNPLIAYQTALSHALTGDLIIVYGSFFTVNQVMVA